jgi:hypothetical protein
MSIAESLDLLHQAQEIHQRITTSIVGHLETQNRRLITELLGLLDFETRRLFEEGFKDTENQVRTLVADLVEGMAAQQRRVIAMKEDIQHCRAEKEKDDWEC